MPGDGLAQYYTDFAIPVTGLQLVPKQGAPNHGEKSACTTDPPPAHIDAQSIVCQIPEPMRLPAASEGRPPRKSARQFPYNKVADLWNDGKTISEIAHTVGWFESDKRDPCHSLRNFLRVMHQKGYMDASGRRVKLPYRVPQESIKAPVSESPQKSQLPGRKRGRPLLHASRGLTSPYNREELYQRVWAQPMQRIAKEYGVSDVALARACKRRGVPVPGVGYWAKKAAGKPVPEQPPLPPEQTDSKRAVSPGHSRLNSLLSGQSSVPTRGSP